MLTDEELDAADPKKTRTIDIEAFVDLEEIDPIFYDHPYYLVPDSNEAAVRAYHLLRAVMERSGQVAIARFVLRTKEYLVAVRTRGDAITLTTMLFHDEVRSPEEVGIDKLPKAKKAEVDQAVTLVKSLQRDFDPANYEDEHRKRLLAIDRQEAQGPGDRDPRRARGAEGGAGPDGRARGVDPADEVGRPRGAGRRRRGRAERRRPPSSGCRRRTCSRARRKPRSRAAPRCRRTSWSKR